MVQNPTDEELRALLGAVRAIAVVGIKADPEADAHRVPAATQARGYKILPVSPKCSASAVSRASASSGSPPNS
jgi:predicted CoA-binding protein